MGVGLTLMGAGMALGAPLPRRDIIGIALITVGLVVVILGAIAHRRPNVQRLIALKEEGTELLNTDPLQMLKRGNPHSAALALSVWRTAVQLWVEEGLIVLRQVGATDGELSDFTTIISFTPFQPAMNAEHSAQKGILGERLHRLRPVIKRLET